MSAAHWSATLTRNGACHEAVTWARTQPSAAAAWRTCERADWLLWIAARLCTTTRRRKQIVVAACACARTSLRFVPPGEDRPRLAIETAEAWAEGRATLEEVRRASASASAAYVDAYAAYADAYASAAASAAAAVAAVAAAAAAAVAAVAAAAAYAAYAAADAADAAAYAAYAAADARSKSLREMADLVRRHLTMPRVPRAKARKVAA